MNSRYGFWVVSICWISLAGCANWQNRANTTGAPGSAANLTLAPAASQTPPIMEPGASFGEPPPPSPNMLNSFPPNQTAPAGPPPERLNLAASEPNQSPRPDQMYNLDRSSRTSSQAGEKSTQPSRKSATISKLAKKASASSSQDEGASAAPAKPASAIKRLSADAEGNSTKASAELESLPKPNRVSAPAKKSEAAPERQSQPAAIVDTALLAQPVRKGADADTGANSDGPQSNAVPDSKLFNGNAKPEIYPVSNPAPEEPVDITQFS